MPNVFFKSSAQRILLDYFFPSIPKSKDKRVTLIPVSLNYGVGTGAMSFSINSLGVNGVSAGEFG